MKINVKFIFLANKIHRECTAVIADRTARVESANFVSCFDVVVVVVDER